MAVLDKREEWDAAFRAGWLAHWEETGEINWKSYNRPKNDPLPTTPGIDLSQSRLLLISTAGAYLRDVQEPFDAANPLGDYSIRMFPNDVAYDALAYAHDHFDHTAVNADPQTLLPLDLLADLVGEGVIGEFASPVISFMGYQPDLTRVVDELIPQIVPLAKDLQVQAALLVPA